MDFACRANRASELRAEFEPCGNSEMLPPRIVPVSALGGGSPAPLETGTAMLEEKTHTITCHLGEADFQRLKKQSDSLGVNMRDFVRVIVRLPIEYVCDPGQDRIIVIDPLELGSLKCIVRKQGYLFNQAVHALNTIAQEIRNGSAMN